MAPRRLTSGWGGRALRASTQATVVALCCFLGGCDDENKEAPADAPIKQRRASQALGPPPWASRRTEDSGFPCEVEEVLAHSCRRCHWEPLENDAPFSLLSYENVLKMRSGKPIHVLMEQMVQNDLMPPLDALVSPDVTPLSPEQKATLLKWLAAGAPKSIAKCP